MAGTVEYLWEIFFYDGTTSYVKSHAPVKARIVFSNGTYRNLPGSGLITIGTGNDILVETTVLPGNTATDVATPIVMAHSAMLSAPDDVLNIPPRELMEPFDCWVFTNAAGDVVATARCNDVKVCTPSSLFPTAQQVSVVTPDDTNLLPQVTNYLYCVGAGTVHVQYPDGHADTITVPANSVRAIQINQVFSTGTTASGILVW